MNIGVLLGSLNGAGAEKTLLTLAEEFAVAGHQVTLFTLSAHKDYTPSSQIEHCVLAQGSRKQQNRSLQSETSRRQLDLFITSKPHYFDYGNARHKLCSVHITPTAWLVDRQQHPIKHFFQRLRLQRRYRKKQLIALSQGIRDDLIGQLGCQPESIHVIPNPYRVEEIRDAAAQPGPLPDAPYIVYVAALNKRKRQSDLLEAFSRISSQSHQLVLVGKGDQEQALRDQAMRLGLQERVIFWGWDSNPYRLIRHADLSMLASEAEGLPRVLVESLIIGTPVVSTDCPSGPSEVLTGELARYLVPVGDIDAMTTAINQVLANPEPTQFDYQRFRADVVADQYLKLFQ